MARIRITPLLKTLGFRKGGLFDGHYVTQDNKAEARIYKVDESTRAIDMWRNIYDEKGGFHHRETIYKRFLLDSDAEDSFDDFLINMSVLFERYRIIENKEYYLGKTPERLVQDRPETDSTSKQSR